MIGVAGVVRWCRGSPDLSIGVRKGWLEKYSGERSPDSAGVRRGGAAGELIKGERERESG